MLENFTHNIRKSWFIWVWARLNQHVLIKSTHISHLSAFSFYVSLLFLVSKKQLIINSSLYNNSSIPLGTKQYDPAVIGRLTQNYNWEISGIFWSDSRPGAPLLWPDHNNNETFKIEFIHKKTYVYMSCVSLKKKNAKHNFFVLILKLTYYAHAPFSKKSTTKLRTRLRPVYSYHVTIVDASFFFWVVIMVIFCGDPWFDSIV